MKKCPYCAEEIQDEAIKCRYCGEFLEVPPPRRVTPGELTPAQKEAVAQQTLEQVTGRTRVGSARPKIKWYHTPHAIVVAFLMVGPFALPMVWTHPTMKPATKVVITVVTLVATYYLTVAFLSSLQSLVQYYKQMGIIFQTIH